MDLGLTASALEDGITKRQHIGAQLVVSAGRRHIVDLAIGESSAGTAMSMASLVPWLSAGKPVIAVAIAQLCQAGVLDLDTPVAALVPAFAGGGKDDGTIRHLLTHTLPLSEDVPHEMLLSSDWDEIIAWICARPSKDPRAAPGTTAAYSFYAGWYLLGEIVQRCSGLTIDRHVRERIFLPLGMDDCWLGLPRGEEQRYGSHLAVLHSTEGGVVRPAPLVSLRSFTRRVVPGVGAVGPMDQLARFYEALLFDDRSGPLGLDRETVRRFTSVARRRLRCDHYRSAVRWGLGFITDRRIAGLPGVPGDCFGHDGLETAVAFALPDAGLVVCLMFNGMLGSPSSAQRSRRTLQALADDLRSSGHLPSSPSTGAMPGRTAGPGSRLRRAHP